MSYLRLVCGLRRALFYAGGAQLVFLVLFSYAFFFEGYTGLTVTIGAVLTLFVLMQLTGRIDWEGSLRVGPKRRHARSKIRGRHPRQGGGSPVHRGSPEPKKARRPPSF